MCRTFGPKHAACRNERPNHKDGNEGSMPKGLYSARSHLCDLEIVPNILQPGCLDAAILLWITCRYIAIICHPCDIFALRLDTDWTSSSQPTVATRLEEPGADSVHVFACNCCKSRYLYVLVYRMKLCSVYCNLWKIIPHVCNYIAVKYTLRLCTYLLNMCVYIYYVST